MSSIPPLNISQLRSVPMEWTASILIVVHLHELVDSMVHIMY